MGISAVMAIICYKLTDQEAAFYAKANADRESQAQGEQRTMAGNH